MTLKTALHRALNRPCRSTFAYWFRPPADKHGSRRAWRRLLALSTQIQTGHLANATQLAAKFHTSLKTIGRDIAFLRKEAGLDIHFDPIKNHYHLPA